MGQNSPKKPADAPQTYAQKVAGKQANIFRAAQSVFAQHGYDGLRMSDVAKQAGVAEGTVYSYFASKDDLIRALVGAYWVDLTRDARAAISLVGGTYERLEALAQFHIDGLIARYAYAELTITLGRQTGSAVSLTDDVRDYVRVFDEVFVAGQDRGDITADAEVWMARDMFYGSLEYSARTLLMRPESQRGTVGVTQNLLASFRARYAAVITSASIGVDDQLIERLEAVAARLEANLDASS